MRAIYSLWTKPMDGNNIGFNSEASLMECFALSLHYSKKWFHEVNLITDLKGKELVDKWGLKFNNINTDLEIELKDIDECNWALGKIYACKIQDKPFIHIDNDVILFKKLPDTFLSKDAAFQSVERHCDYKFYSGMIAYDRDNYKLAPKWYSCPSDDEGFSYNCGVILFNKLDYLKEWWSEAIRYIKYFDKKDGFPPIIFEQHFIASICSYYNLDVALLTDYHSEENKGNSWITDDLAERLGYTHLISSVKRQVDVEKLIKDRLVFERVKLNY